MSVHFQLTIDCVDPNRQVAFWAEALGYVPAPPPPGHPSWKAYYQHLKVPEEELATMGENDVDSIVDPAGGGPRIWFQIVPEVKSIKNRLHLDVRVADRKDAVEVRREVIDAEVERLAGLGASVLRVLSAPGVDHYGVTMLDPEGNEFCVC